MTQLKDQKEGLTSARKPDITHLRLPTAVYLSRACEYGNLGRGYQRANYLRRTGGPKEDFERYRGYLRAMVSHGLLNLDAMERHLSQDPDLQDVEGMKRAMYAADTDQPPNGAASGLPHLCGALASGQMAVVQAIDAGMLPADPGRPWEAAK